VRAWVDLLESGQPEFEFAFRPSIGEQTGRSVDPVLHVVPQLPPIWVRSPALQVVARVDDQPIGLNESGASSEARALVRLYALSARAALGESVVLPVLTGEETPGVAFVWEIVSATAGSSAQQLVARDRLRVRIQRADEQPWVEAWARVALGRSLLLEADLDTQRRGLVHLLHVPARFGDDYPYLSGVALLDVLTWLTSQGRGSEARRVWDEASARFGGAIDLGPAPVTTSPSKPSNGNPATGS
jgi:hypothetical protein